MTTKSAKSGKSGTSSKQADNQAVKRLPKGVYETELFRLFSSGR